MGVGGGGGGGGFFRGAFSQNLQFESPSPPQLGIKEY